MGPLKRTLADLPSWLLVSLFVVALAACTDQKDDRGTNPLPDVKNESDSATWLGVGNEIRKARASGTIPITDKSFPPTLSAPLDIRGLGTYTLWGGPVPAGVDPPDTVSFPPDFGPDAAYSIAGPPALALRDGVPYAYVRIRVTRIPEPYQGLRTWFQ